jgi:SAM-dependent methyltransferase
VNAPLTYPLARNPAEHARLALQAQFWSADAAALFESAGLAVGSCVADLGCGTLHVANLLRRFVGPAGKVFAIDNDDALLDTAHAESDRRIVVERGDAYALPWDDSSLDAAHARFLAAPAGRLDRLVGEMHRLVRPGGMLILQEPIADGWEVPNVGDAWPRALELIRAGFRHRGGDFDVGRQLRSRLEAAGVSAIRTRMVRHQIAAAHPYASLPLAFCDSLAPLWREAGLVSDAEFEALRAALEFGLRRTGATVTTFTLVQVWGRR